MKEFIVTLLMICAFNGAKAQSYVMKTNSDKIECAKIEFRSEGLVLRDESSTKISKIELDSVKSFYRYEDNVLFHNKGRFLELFIEGDIQVYRGGYYFPDVLFGDGPRRDIEEDGLHWFPTNTATTGFAPTNWGSGSAGVGGGPTRYTNWYVEKDGLLFHAFSVAEYPLREDMVDFKREDLAKVFDDEHSRQSFSKLEKKVHGDEILQLIQSYNAGNCQRKQKTGSLQSPDESSQSKVIVFRDFRKENKAPLNFTVGETAYTLDRNSKLEITIPTEKKSVLQFTHPEASTSAVITASPDFIKYYQITLDKKNNGTITKINGNDPYYRSRLEYYDRRKKNSKRLNL